METLTAIADALNRLNPHIIYTVAVFFVIGVIMFISEVKPDATGKVERKRVIWLRWSLFVSAFVVSPLFFATALVAGFFGWLNQSEKNWKYALAIVCVVYALYVR